jgi:hypothetical protein
MERDPPIRGPLQGSCSALVVRLFSPDLQNLDIASVTEVRQKIDTFNQRTGQVDALYVTQHMV